MGISTETGSQPVDRSQAGEDYPLTAVPIESRRSLLSMAFMLLGFTLYSGTFFAGGLVGPAFRFFPDLLVLLVVGNLILGGYAAALGYIASKTGLSTVLMARYSFGSVGSRWVDFILGFTQIGWYAWGSGLIADLLNKLAGVPESWNWLIVLFLTYFFCITAYIGYRAMDWYSRIAVPAIIILMLWSLSVSLNQVGGFAGAQAIQPTTEMSIGAALTVIVGTFISGGTQATNWSRFADSPRTATLGTLAAFFIANGFVVFGGAFCALVYQDYDMVSVMAKQGLLIPGFILLFLNMWSTQDNTIYAFSIAFCHMFRTRKRTFFVLIGATISLFLTWGGIYESQQFINFLILLGTFIPPVGGVVMADYWLYRQGTFPSLDQPQPAFNWAGIIAYVLASAIAYFSSEQNIGIAPINGIVAAVVIYYVLAKALSRDRSRAEL